MSVMDEILFWIARKRGIVIASGVPPEVQAELKEMDRTAAELTERIRRIHALSAPRQAAVKAQEGTRHERHKSN